MDNITVPRAAVEALVDPEAKPYMQPNIIGDAECLHCEARRYAEHASWCPVRIIQQALAQPQPPTDAYRAMLVEVAEWMQAELDDAKDYNRSSSVDLRFLARIQALLGI